MTSIEEQLRKYGCTELYHLTHLANLDSIMRDGLLPRSVLPPNRFTDIANHGVVDRRAGRFLDITEFNSKQVIDFVPFFIAPINPMSAACDSEEICWVVVSAPALYEYRQSCVREEVLIAFSDGNMGSRRSNYYWDLADLDQLDWDLLRAPRWKGLGDEARRRRAAEFLVAPRVLPECFLRVETRNTLDYQRAREVIIETGVPLRVHVKRQHFFSAGCPSIPLESIPLEPSLERFRRELEIWVANGGTVPRAVACKPELEALSRLDHLVLRKAAQQPEATDLFEWRRVAASMVRLSPASCTRRGDACPE